MQNLQELKVGAFGDAMGQISDLKLDDAIFNFIDTGKPFIGINSNEMQLLFESSEEFRQYKGLGIIKYILKNLSLVILNKLNIPYLK